MINLTSKSHLVTKKGTYRFRVDVERYDKKAIMLQLLEHSTLANFTLNRTNSVNT